MFPLSSRQAVIATVATSLLAVPLAGVALGAAPLPQTAKAYSTGGSKHGVSLTLITSASDPKAIEPGEAVLASQYAQSGGAVLCKKAKKSPGFHETPFAVFGFPGAELKLVNGKYSFSKTYKTSDASVLGSSAKPFKLKVKIVGTVVSPTSIAGTVKPTGGPCTSKKPLKFTAKLDSKIPVAPGQ